MFKINKITNENISNFLNWQYDDKYSFYNINEKYHKEESRRMLEEDYYQLIYENELFGIFKYELEGAFIEVGLGINPEYTSKGFGKDFLDLCLNFARYEYDFEGAFILNVWCENKRAIKLYQNAGFIEYKRDITSAYGKVEDFIFMIKF